MNSLVSIKDLPYHTVEWLLQNAESFAQYNGGALQRGTVVNLFFEPSTRTGLSFQMASHRLGLEIMDFSIEGSSIKKGESLQDTLETLDALGVDIAIIRRGDNWPAQLNLAKLRMSVVNAGSGIFEHPTQALLDALTIKQHFGRLQNLKVTIVGDIRHSRVARSNVELLTKMGAEIYFAGPAVFQAEDLTQIPRVDLDWAVQNSHVLMLLRVQLERHELAYDLVNYHKEFGLTEGRLRLLNKSAIIMHPGPVNRGVEICDAALDDPRSRVLTQVQNGVAARMAVLDWCLQGGPHDKLVSA